MREPYLGKWTSEIQKLRSILLACGLDEDQKWGKPCFLFEGTNVAIIQPFKESCALMFFKGALLQDTHGLLRSQGKNTQSALRLQFTSEAQIKKTVVASYAKQAIAIERAGLSVDFKAKNELAQLCPYAFEGPVSLRGMLGAPVLDEHGLVAGVMTIYDR